MVYAALIGNYGQSIKLLVGGGVGSSCIELLVGGGVGSSCIEWRSEVE